MTTREEEGEEWEPGCEGRGGGQERGEGVGLLRS